MRFFEHQRAARAQSRRLSFWFALIVLGEVLIANLLIAIPFAFGPALAGQWQQAVEQLPRYFFWTNTAIVLLFVLGGWWIAAAQLSDGGEALALRIGAHQAQKLENNRNIASAAMAEMQLSNIVQELAIASRMRVPKAYVLSHEDSINAFAAGWSESDSVICVTQGALDYLNRDELMGLVAHELSHIYEGDTKLNMRLAGMVLGLELVYHFGYDMLHNEQSPAKILGPFVLAAGWLGWMGARLLKAAISREREYLADARAVQFTRSKEGLGGTLRKVLWQHETQGMVSQGLHPAVQHMLLVGDWLDDAQSKLRSHPPLGERIKRIYGRPMQGIEAVDAVRENWKNPFATSQPSTPLA